VTETSINTCEATSERVAYTIAEFSARFGKSRFWGYEQARKKKIRVIEGYGEKMIPASEIGRILNAGGEQ
jgi:hypothetical protein